MYQQDDLRIAIYRNVVDEDTGIKGRHNVVAKWGCLFLSLLHIAEVETDRKIGGSDIKEIYARLVGHGHMREDCYVLNHAAIIEMGLGYLKSNIKPTYLGKMKFDINVINNYHGFTHILKQSLTQNGNSHFYYPGADTLFDKDYRFKKDLSIRFYRLA